MDLTLLYTEQMDAEGLGRKLLLTLSGDPRRTLEKQIVGTATTNISQNAHPASTEFRALSMPALQREAASAKEKVFREEKRYPRELVRQRFCRTFG